MARIVSYFVIAFSVALPLTASSVFAEPRPPANLFGRALGLDLSHDRECRDVTFSNTDRHAVFFKAYVESILNFGRGYGAADRDDFISEFVFASFQTHENCDQTREELDSYWNALEEQGFLKVCAVFLLTPNEEAPEKCRE